MTTDDPAPAPLERGPQPIPPGIRWLLIVFLPAIGFILGAFFVFSVVDLQFGAGLAILCILGGIAGAVFLLVTALVAGPWLPAGATPTSAAIGIVPAAAHPDGLSWVGPAAAVLIGLGAGIPLGAGLTGERRYSSSGQLEPFTKTAIIILVFGTLATLLLLIHQRHGPASLPLAHPPLHRLVFRSLLRAVLGALAAAIAGWVALLVFEGNTSVSKTLFMGAAFSVVLTTSLTIAEAISWRVRDRWRWPLLLACGALQPLVVVATIMFFRALFQRASALAALDGMLGELAKDLKRDPSGSLGAGVSATLPFALAVAARTGLLPYFGRRAPWPILAQVPLAWLACAMGLALLHLLVDSVTTRDLQEIVPYLAAAVPMLLVGMRLSDPLEARIASRWVLLTGGRD